MKKLNNMENEHKEHKTLLEAARPLIEYIQKHHDPHTKIIVDCTSAEVLSGEIAVDINDEFLK